MIGELRAVPFPGCVRSSRRETSAFPASVVPAARGRALLEHHFDGICLQLQRLARRSGLPASEAEELRSWALFKLVEDGYRILAQWTGRSSFETYLTVVLVNLMRDYRIHLWGKWRPSAYARKCGPEALFLERLWQRDGSPLAEAIERTRRAFPQTLTPDELERIAGRLPQRCRRHQVGEAALEQLAVAAEGEIRIEARENRGMAIRIREVLSALLRKLSVDDGLLLRLHIRDGLSMAAIAPLLGTSAQRLYSRHNRCLLQLRRELERAGLTAAEGRAIELDAPDLWP